MSDKQNIKYSDFFINIPEDQLPVPGTPERKTLRKQERDRCLGGVYVDGVFISGWLYWHINFWWITDDEIDEYGNIVPWESVSSLRDNEWIRAEAFEKCRTHPDGIKGYIEVGLRQGAKTSSESSFSAYNATMFKSSQNIIISGTDDDMGNIKLRLNYGLNKLHPIIKKPKLTKDKRAKYVTLGYKTKEGDEEIWSYIITRNIAEGQNTEGPAGVSAKSAIFDEIGKAPFSQALEALKPALMSKFGWRAMPILMGTGGAFEKGEDAERIFYHPEANNFLGFYNEATGETTGLFMPGTFRTDCKYRTNVADYLISKGKLKDGNYPELSKIPIDVSDEVKALEKIKNERSLKANDPDKTEYLKNIMYFPLTPKECFMKGADNMFNTDIAIRQKDKLLLDFPGGRIGIYVELEETIINGEKTIIAKPSDKLPISSYPHKHNENRDAPIVILEHPEKDPPYGMYVSGADPFRHVVATKASDSNGAIYIFKRMYDSLSDKYQDMPIAWYVGRPKDKGTWNDNARKLIKYYNAHCLCENDEYGFIEYMINKGEGHMMLDTPGWLREIAPTSNTLSRPKGMSSANKQIRELALGTLKEYIEEPFTTLRVVEGNEVKVIPVPGAARIFDPMLLEEIIKWNPDANVDRIVACSFAITCARKMDAQGIRVVSQDEVIEKPQKVYREQKLFKPLHSSNNNNSRTSQDKLRKLMK